MPSVVSAFLSNIQIVKQTQCLARIKQMGFFKCHFSPVLSCSQNLFVEREIYTQDILIISHVCKHTVGSLQKCIVDSLDFSEFICM